jgi:hypothetical protein
LIGRFGLIEAKLDLTNGIDDFAQTNFAFSAITQESFYNFPLGIGQLSKLLTPLNEVIMEEKIYINNAGLVILNGYLSYFFDRCGLLGEKGFAGPDAATRAACLLQYVYDPASAYGEEALVLNKLLSGLHLNTVLPIDFEATELEKEVTGQMLDAVISHWEIITNSTHEGFRESWLWREGKLSWSEKGWELLIEQRPFDVLLDYIPFSISPVQFSWMELPIKVIWR